MVFRTIDIKKDNSNTRKRHCNYSFEVFLDIDAKKDDAFEVLLYATEALQQKRYSGICIFQLSDNNVVKCMIKDFPERRRRRFINVMEKFAHRLREETGTLYSFNIE